MSSWGCSVIKSELVQRMAARNPHLYQRDIENIIDAILGEIADALARGERVELRGFGAFSTKQRQARTGPQPAHRRQGAGDREACALLQDRQGDARASQSRAGGTGLAPAAVRRRDRTEEARHDSLPSDRRRRRRRDHSPAVRLRQPADRDGVVRSVRLGGQPRLRDPARRCLRWSSSPPCSASIAGSAATWVSQGRHRRAARRHRADADRWRARGRSR